MEFKRVFTHRGHLMEHVFQYVQWKTLDIIISDDRTGEPIFEQKNVEFPVDWSYEACKIVASRYFYGKFGEPERERSLKQLISRVVTRIVETGKDNGYFPEHDMNEDQAHVMGAELTYMLLHQMFAWNSPVWFNVGTPNRQGVSACYITQVDDNLESIIENVGNEMRIFADGSGNGFNASRMRGSKEGITGGGTSSGPISFMKIYDAGAGVVKSGGKTRRAAKMVLINDDHPDVEEFITCKSTEEAKAKALIQAGYDGSFDGEATRSVFFQNANHSVRLTDKFMQAVDKDGDWNLINRVDGKVAKTVKARYLWDLIAKEAWQTGDPGIQFHDIIQEWHTCKADGEIEATNPCAEYVFLNWTSCNLGSLNLVKFWDKHSKQFQIERFEHAVLMATLSMNILIDLAEFPVEKIAKGTKTYRTIGIGYANVGALLMLMGIPYDSMEARQVLGAITSLMTSSAYRSSAALAQLLGPFPAYVRNSTSMLDVIERHTKANKDLADESMAIYNVPAILEKAAQNWQVARFDGRRFGFRNAQTTVIAPTGTISFMMDCDTTGVEPEIGLEKHKSLVNGGSLSYMNNVVKDALKALGYSDKEVEQAADNIRHGRKIDFKDPEHRKIFACSLDDMSGADRWDVVPPEAHVLALGAVAPFLSGSASKTCNLPSTATVEDIQKLYRMAYTHGVKCIAVFRDKSKATQPMSTSKPLDSQNAVPVKTGAIETSDVWISDPVHYQPPNIGWTTVSGMQVPQLKREEMPRERESRTAEVQLNGNKAYFTMGQYPDGRLGEVFITMSLQGSFAHGLMDSIGVLISLALQWGVPLEDIVRKLKGTKFSPAGFTGNPEIPQCNSVLDYLGQLLEKRYLQGIQEPKGKIDVPENFATAEQDPIAESYKQYRKALMTTIAEAHLDRIEYTGNPCPDCGTQMVYMGGRCAKCPNCGHGGECGS